MSTTVASSATDGVVVVAGAAISEDPTGELDVELEDADGVASGEPQPASNAAATAATKIA